MCKLATVLGASQRVNFANEATEVTRNYRINLVQYDHFKFEIKFVVMSFLSALVGIGNVNICET